MPTTLAMTSAAGVHSAATAWAMSDRGDTPTSCTRLITEDYSLKPVPRSYAPDES